VGLFLTVLDAIKRALGCGFGFHDWRQLTPIAYLHFGVRTGKFIGRRVCVRTACQRRERQINPWVEKWEKETK